MRKKNRSRRGKQTCAQNGHDVEGAGWRSKVKGRNTPAGAVQAVEKDITLDAFANNSRPLALQTRTSKAATMSHKEVKQEAKVNSSLVAKDDDDREVLDDWYTYRDTSSEDEGDKSEDCTTADKGSETCGGVPKTDRVSADPGNSADGTVERGTNRGSPTFGQVYPPIIWYLVSAFIDPEDVGTFACLCRDTQALTNTAAFWRKLYFRFYSEEKREALPKELHPTSIQRTFGLRSLVIRSLQYLYPPFVRRNNTALADGRAASAAEQLTGMVFMYHVSWTTASNHVYFMKFRRPDGGPTGADEAAALAAALPRDPDIYHNRRSDQCMLAVVCKQLHRIQPEHIMGKELAYVGLSVSTGMTYSRLRLEFQEPAAKRGRHSSWTKRDSHSHSSSRNGNRSGRTTLLLDPVVYTQVYHWWHPHFQETTFLVDEKVPSISNLNMWNATT